tara:strand:+ start:3583 stop:4332 length:750 start_codon:yes stop_codon:yes gene_type:complete
MSLKLSDNLNIGKNNYIESGVKIFENVIIGNNNKIYGGTVIYPNTVIGDNNVILNNNILGEYGVEAKDDNFKEKKFGGLIIGNNNYFHVNNLIFSGFYRKTEIGHHNKFLSQVTIHHDNIIRNYVVFYPRAITAGLCTLMDHATMGMNSCLQQKSVIGSYSMIGMGSIASHNVFPFYIYFNGKYQRFNKVKIPDNLYISLIENEDKIYSLIQNLKKNNCDLKFIENTGLPGPILNIIYDFFDKIVIRKI